MKTMLYSGGLDSFVLARTLLNSQTDIKLLAFDIGTHENRTELNLISSDPFIQPYVEVVDLNLAQFELTNKILPFRNMFLLLAAATYGDSIYIGSTQADIAQDSTDDFFNKATAVLDLFGEDSSQTKHGATKFTIERPYVASTKAGYLLGYCDRFGLDAFVSLLESIGEYSRSCYHVDADTLEECGECLSCVRKSVALHFVDNVLVDKRVTRAVKSILANFKVPLTNELLDFSIEALKSKCVAYPEKAEKELIQIASVQSLLFP